MCMTMRKEVSINRLDAFKVFVETDKGLQSPFQSCHKANLIYVPGKRIEADEEDRRFFAFDKFTHAVNIVNQGHRHWCLVRGTLLVLPVILWDVTTFGKFHVPSDDPQCMDGYYPSYESKAITVNDSPDIRSVFEQKLLCQYFNMKTLKKKPYRILNVLV